MNNYNYNNNLLFILNAYLLYGWIFNNNNILFIHNTYLHHFMMEVMRKTCSPIYIWLLNVLLFYWYLVGSVCIPVPSDRTKIICPIIPTSDSTCITDTTTRACEHVLPGSPANVAGFCCENACPTSIMGTTRVNSRSCKRPGKFCINCVFIYV